MQETHFAPTVILIDAAWIDHVAFELTVNFERTLERRIPPASLTSFIECLALDGGVRPGAGDIQVFLLHPAAMESMRCFAPSQFASALDGVAYQSPLGEVSIYSAAADGPVAYGDFLTESFSAVLAHEGVERLLVVSDIPQQKTPLERARAEQSAARAEVVLFALGQVHSPLRCENLAYPLLHALQIQDDDIRRLGLPQS